MVAAYNCMLELSTFIPSFTSTVGSMCRNYVLSYLWSQPKLPPFVVQGLVTLYSRITKLGWFDSEKEDFVFRNAISDVTKFLGGSAEQCMMGIQLLSQLTCEMNQVKFLSRYRTAVLWIQIRMFLDLPDPYPDPFGTSTDPAPDPSIIKQK
jgi:hypothetical protein